MASLAGQKPLILTAAEADLQRAETKARLAASQIKAPVRRSSGPIVYAVAALILLAAGYFLFSGNWNTMMLFPTASETVPSPDINATVAPLPADAPAGNP
jgi:cytochrome c-type biogenesis protein CcmH/NrfG